MMLNLTKKVLERKYKIFSISNGTIVSFILIASTILMPFSLLPREAEAQFSSSSALGVSGYVRGLAPAIAKLPQCREEIGSEIKKLFSGIGEMFSGGETGGSEEDFGGTIIINAAENKARMDKAAERTTNLDTLTASKAIQVNSAPSAAETNRLLKLQIDEQIKLGKTAEKINAQSSCIASIGRLIAKMLLQKLTLSTVMWINSGYNGSPSFLQDPGKFFKDIADTEILQFGIEINGINPYSRDWLKNQALAYKTKFAENARYSLEEMIAQTTPDCGIDPKDGRKISCATAFSQDFSVGGWDAWTAMTQVPANNPLGAKLMFDNEIQKRLADTSQSIAKDTRDALQAANGFLGDKRCISAATGRIDNNVTEIDYINGLKEKPPVKLCSSFTYVTPGKMISDAATTAIGYQNNSLLNVEDLNDAVAAVSDAILNQFSTSIYQKGFANLDYQGIDGVLVFNNSNSDFRTQTEKDYMPSQLSSSWLQANPDFNIRTDLTQALIDEQRTYSDKLALQNKELMSTTDGQKYNYEWSSMTVEDIFKNNNCPDDWYGSYPYCYPTYTVDFQGGFSFIPKNCPNGWSGTFPLNCKAPGSEKEEKPKEEKPSDGRKTTNAYGLMPAIYQLDYCIPGPHPGWQDDSRETLASKLNSLTPAGEQPPNTAGDIVNGAIGVGINVGASFIPGVGSFVGPVLSGLFGALTGDNDIKNQSTATRRYYTRKFYDLTGFTFQAIWNKGTDARDASMASQGGLFYVLNTVLDRYINIMNKTYFSSPDMLPTISKEAEKEFNQLSGYNQIIKDNKNKMLEIKTTVSILGEIKEKVDELNTDIETNKKTEEQYEEALKFQINAFGRLSANMVNGDDIAAADDLAKQIVQKKDFIYKNLLKGPYGCEADLEKQQKNFPSITSGVKNENYNWGKFNVNSVKRMTYPFPIIYDYNNFAKEETLPDPWKSGYDKEKLPKMPAENKYSDYGPGFLSFVHFAASYVEKPGNNVFNGSERLQLGDLVNNYDPCGESGNHCDLDWKPLGESKFNRGPGRIFEQTIGIY